MPSRKSPKKIPLKKSRTKKRSNKKKQKLKDNDAQPRRNDIDEQPSFLTELYSVPGDPIPPGGSCETDGG